MAKKKTPSETPDARTGPAAPRRRTTTTPTARRAGGNGDARPGPTHEEIAEAAYHRYLSRKGGQTPGSDFDDWLEAERELRQGPRKTS